MTSCIRIRYWKGKCLGQHSQAAELYRTKKLALKSCHFNILLSLEQQRNLDDDAMLRKVFKCKLKLFRLSKIDINEDLNIVTQKQSQEHSSGSSESKNEPVKKKIVQNEMSPYSKAAREL